MSTIPTPQDWQAALSVTRGVSEQRAFVVKHTRAFLERGAVVDCSTKILTDTLWPPQYAVAAAAIEARKRMVNHLLRAAHNDLAGYARKADTTKRYMGKEVHPWLWSAPKSATPAASVLTCCPHCGGSLETV